MKELQIFVHIKRFLKNVISNRELCDFYFPGIIQEEESGHWNHYRWSESKKKAKRNSKKNPERIADRT